MGNGTLGGRSASVTVTSTPGVVGFSSSSGLKYKTYGNSENATPAPQPSDKTGSGGDGQPGTSGPLPQGVTHNPSTGLYEAHIRATSGRFIDLGAYQTAREAHDKYMEALPIHRPGQSAYPGEPDAADKDAAEIANSEASPAAPRPTSFTVELDFETTPWRPLGLRLTPSGDKTQLIVMEVLRGPVADWSAQNPHLRVKPRDRIIEVNGEKGETNVLVEALKNKEKLTIAIQTPKEFTVSLNKQGHSKVGLEVDRSDKTLLHVRCVKPGGLVEQWNQANPDLAIAPYHAIVAVNGVRGDTETMLHAIFFEDDVEMVLS